MIDAPYLYRRGGSPYQDSRGADWPDNLQRFALLGWVGAHLAAGELDEQWTPDVLHAHDWHAAPGLRLCEAASGARRRPRCSRCTTWPTRALFPPSDFGQLGLPARAMAPSGLEFHGQLSFMKAGLKFADRITTVSPSYAREIATPEFGCGPRRRDPRPPGRRVRHPQWRRSRGLESRSATPRLAARYDAERLEGKAVCKEALQRELGLAVRAGGAAASAVVSRLTSQKGLDLVLGALARTAGAWRAARRAGHRRPALEAAFREAAQAHPERVAVRLAYDEVLAHRVIGGADVIVVPSRFEPCGLTQLYGLRYGTLPLVRRVGGLGRHGGRCERRCPARGQGHRLRLRCADRACARACDRAHGRAVSPARALARA